MPELIKQILDETGFDCYENVATNSGASGMQLLFYGTSDKFNAFKTLASNKFRTGTVAYLVDTGNSYMYSQYKNTWY